MDMVALAARPRAAVRPAAASRFRHVDLLRALAVCLVVFAHAGFATVVPGGTGVTIFFSISGFIITHLVLRELDRTGTFRIDHFYARRALKIVPPFIVLSAVPTLLWATTNHFELSAFASQVFFVFNWWVLFGSGHGVPGGSDVLWSLAVEEQFYIVVALVWCVGVRMPNPRALIGWVAGAALLTSTVLRLVLAVDPGNTSRIYYGTDTRMDGLALGMLSAVLLTHWERGGARLLWLRRFLASAVAIPAALGVGILTLEVHGAYFQNTHRYTLQSLATCVVLLAGFQVSRSRAHMALARVSRCRIVAFLGLASYSTYLFNLTLVKALQDNTSSGRTEVTIVALVLCNLVGLISWRLLERPFERVRARLH
jgi:peptidoglycan/LPS O-acetylase OafA/YrhL